MSRIKGCINCLIILGICILIRCREDSRSVWSKEEKTEEEIEHAFRCAKRDMMNNRHGTPVSTIRSILAMMGSPQLSYPTFHVTGTNGKGSVVYKVAFGLIEAGYKVGYYQSPHIHSIRERFQINSQPISFADFTYHHQLCNMAFTQNKEINHWKRFDYFGKSMCIASSYFRSEEVDAAVFEVGVGGRSDHTNVIIPEVSIITSIGLDHTKSLGSTKEEILRNKAGIFKEGKPCVVAEGVPLDTAREMATQVGCPLYIVNGTKQELSFDIINANLATQALNLVRNKFRKLDEEAIKRGVKAKPQCRMQKVEQEQLDALAVKWKLAMLPSRVYMDVGHNPQAISHIMNWFNSTPREEKLRIVAAFSRGHGIEKSMKIILETADHLHLVHANHKKSLKIKDLDKIAFEYQTKFGIFDTEIEESMKNGDVSKTIEYAFRQISEGGEAEILLICGSLFMMKETLHTLGYPVIKDISAYKHNTLDEKTCRRQFLFSD